MLASACLRRSLHTRPALGDTHKILKSRHVAMERLATAQEKSLMTQLLEFKGWLKGMFPLARTIRGIPKVEPSSEERELVNGQPGFDRKLRHCTEYIVNQNAAPMPKVLVQLMRHTLKPEAAQIVLRALRAYRAMGGEPSVNIANQFVEMTVRIASDDDEGFSLDLFKTIMKTAIEEALIPMTPQILETISSQFSSLVSKTETNPPEAQTRALQYLNHAKSYVQYCYPQATRSEFLSHFLPLLVALDRLSVLDGMDNHQIGDKSYPDYIFDEIKIASSNLEDRALSEPVFADLFEAFFKRSQPLGSGEWVKCKANEELAHLYNTYNLHLLGADQASVAEALTTAALKLQQISASQELSKLQISKRSAFIQRAIDFIHNHRKILH